MYIFLQNSSIMNILDPIFFITRCFYDFRQWPPRDKAENWVNLKKK